MNDEDNTEDISDYRSQEVVSSLGNMFLVRDNEGIKQVPTTHKNRLLYERGFYKILNSSNKSKKIVLTDEEDEQFVAIAPTENDSVYKIWIDDNTNPVKNPPSMSEKVLSGVEDSIDSPSDYECLRNVYQEIQSKRVRRSVIKRVARLFPKSEVIPEEDGWNIKGVFLLTWDARVFLNTGGIDEQTVYRVVGSHVSEIEESKQYLQISFDDDIVNSYRGNVSIKIRHHINDKVNYDELEVKNNKCPTCGNKQSYRYYDSISGLDVSDDQDVPVYICHSNDCSQTWREYKLTQKENEFVSKAQLLLNYREKLPDDAFWDVIESHILK